MDVFVRHAWIFELVSQDRLYKIDSLGPTEEAQKDKGQRVNDSLLSKSNQKDNTKGKIGEKLSKFSVFEMLADQSQEHSEQIKYITILNKFSIYGQMIKLSINVSFKQMDKPLLQVKLH